MINSAPDFTVLEDPEFETAKARERKISRERRDALQSLVANAGWKVFVELLEEQYTLRAEQIVLIPTDSQSRQEFMKGEATMIKTVIGLPQEYIESDSITLLREGKDEDDGS